MREQMTVHEPAAALALASPVQGRIIMGLAAQALTLSALSRQLGMSLSLLHYHVNKHIAMGLIEVVREEPRAGRNLKVYRATAKTFFVPAKLLNRLPGSDLAMKLREALDRRQTASVRGVNFGCDGEHVRVQLVRSPESQATAIELWLDVRLTRADAACLVQEMHALMDRFRALDKPREPRYLVQLAAVRK